MLGTNAELFVACAAVRQLRNDVFLVGDPFAY